MTMQRRRRAAPPMRRGPKRNTIWSTQGSQFTIPATGGETSVDLLLGLETALGYNAADWTIIRSIGRIQVSDPGGPAANTAYGAWGIGVFNENLTAYPEPVGEYDDWLYVDSMNFQQEATALTALLDPVAGVSWDIRSKRKMHDLGKELRFVYTSFVTAGSGLTASLFTRTLVMLP